MRLRDKVCLVTDGAAMDRPAIAAEFLSEGAHVVLQAPDRAAAERELAKDDIAAGRIQWIEADFSERGIAEREIDRLVSKVGRLDVLVNNGARPHRRPRGEPFVQMDDDELDSIFEKLVLELLYTSRAALTHMLAAGRGRIVNLGIDRRRRRFPQFVAYCAARAAAVGFTLSLAKEVAAQGVYVNTIVQNTSRTVCTFARRILRTRHIWRVCGAQCRLDVWAPHETWPSLLPISRRMRQDSLPGRSSAALAAPR